MLGLAGSFTTAAISWIESLHDAVTQFFQRTDNGGRFEESLWTRPEGGGGQSRSMSEGEVFERVGVNRSAVDGVLSPELSRRLGLHLLGGEAARFAATGMSVVAHPRSPRIPTVHLNVRYFEVTSAGGDLIDAWFGGGTDLTPTYPEPDDARHFHRVLKDACDRHDPGYYPRFKAACDVYFRNRHRQDEARGVGGIFFDHLRPGSEGPGRLHAFVADIGRILPAAYGYVVERRRLAPWGDRERHLQLLRRGRYVEFNLLHDRGTAFGLDSGARADSVLMSLPPLARWDGETSWDEGSIEERLQGMLVPRDWA